MQRTKNSPVDKFSLEKETKANYQQNPPKTSNPDNHRKEFSFEAKLAKEGKPMGMKMFPHTSGQPNQKLAPPQSII